jgi:hypothetical protein
MGVECIINIDIIIESHSRGMYACEKNCKALKMNGIYFYLLDVACLTCI